MTGPEKQCIVVDEMQTSLVSFLFVPAQFFLEPERVTGLCGRLKYVRNTKGAQRDEEHCLRGLRGGSGAETHC